MDVWRQQVGAKVQAGAAGSLHANAHMRSPCTHHLLMCQENYVEGANVNNDRQQVCMRCYAMRCWEQRAVRGCLGAKLRS